MYDGKNIWVFKPNDCNRGRGVQIFNKMEELYKIIAELTNDESSSTHVN